MEIMILSTHKNLVEKYTVGGRIGQFKPVVIFQDVTVLFSFLVDEEDEMVLFFTNGLAQIPILKI